MKYIALLSIISFALAAQLPTFEIDLNSNPITRYDHITKHYSERFTELTKEFKNGVLKLIPMRVQHTLRYIYDNMIKKNHIEYSLELKGIADSLNTTESDLFILQATVELLAACTSIVVSLPDGTVIHGRNLDYDVFTNILKGIRYLGIYKKDGKEQFRCIEFSGLIGLTTCVKPGKFALSFNERYDEEGGDIMNRLLEALYSGYLIGIWAFREVMEQANSYAEAVEMLVRFKSIGYGYYTISGPGKNEGMVISRSREKADDLWKLTEDEWFLVQVNTDWWKPIPPNDLDRRTLAQQRIKEIGRENMNMQRLLNDVLRKHPNNYRGTIFNSVFCSVNGTFIFQLNE